MTPAQNLARATDPYFVLVRDLADRFEPGERVCSQDIPALNDDQLALILAHEDGIGHDAARPLRWAEILNSAVHVTHEDRVMALGQCLRDAINFEALSMLAEDVGTELYQRSEPVGDPMARAMDEAGVSLGDFL